MSGFNWGSSNNNSSGNTGGFNWGSSGNNSTSTNNNNNNSGGGGGFNWGSSGNNNSNNNNNNSGGGSGFNFGAGNGNNQSQNQNQSQFVTRDTPFSQLPADRQKMFLEFDKQVIAATEEKKSNLAATIKKLEQLPDISASLTMYADQTRLLTEKLSSYAHDLEPFTTKLKAEFVYASQVQVDVQRQSRSGMALSTVQASALPPSLYWDKVNEFETQLVDLRKQLENLQQHLTDSMDAQQTEIISTKSVTNALNASHRTTLNIAARVISNHNRIQTLKEEYKKFRLQHFGDSHDPFFDRSARKNGSVAKIEQYVSRGLELNGLQTMDTNVNGANGNGNGNGNGNTSGWGNSSSNANNASGNNNGQSSGGGFNWGGGSSSNSGNSGNNNSGGGGGGSGFNFGTSNTGNNNSSGNSNNTSSSTGFSWGGGSTGGWGTGSFKAS